MERLKRDLRLFPYALATALILSLINNKCKAQALKADYVDEFNGVHMKQTKFKAFCMDGGMTSQLSILSMNDSLYFIKIKLMLTPGVHSIDKGDAFDLKLNDGKVIELYNYEYVTSCSGCGSLGLLGAGAQGSESIYYIDNESLKHLESTEVKKIRIYTTRGMHDCDISEKNADIIIKHIALLKG